MKIVVTGATSFVGLGAVRELLHRGHQVYAVLREHSTKADLLRENGKFPQGLTILEEDLGESLETAGTDSGRMRCVSPYGLARCRE